MFFTIKTFGSLTCQPLTKINLNYALRLEQYLPHLWLDADSVAGRALMRLAPLAAELRAGGRAIHEEALIELLLDDLRRAASTRDTDPPVGPKVWCRCGTPPWRG